MRLPANHCCFSSARADILAFRKLDLVITIMEYSRYVIRDILHDAPGESALPFCAMYRPDAGDTYNSLKVLNRLNGVDCN